MIKKSQLQPDLTAFDIDLRNVDTHHVISAVHAYLDLMEKQMIIVQDRELAILEKERPPGNDEEEKSLHWNNVSHLERLFEEDLFPSMRYSFVVLLHTVFETRLRAFCEKTQRTRNLQISLTDLRGSAVDQAKKYLAKLVGIQVGDFPEWSHLQHFQKIRDCIVHQYGYLSPDDDRHQSIRNYASTSKSISITSHDRIVLSMAFCEQHHANIKSFFTRLFEETEARS